MSIEETVCVRLLKATVPLENQDPLVLEIRLCYQCLPDRNLETKQIFQFVQNAVQGLVKNSSNFQDVGYSMKQQLTGYCRTESKLEVSIKIDRGNERFVSEIKRKPLK